MEQLEVPVNCRALLLVVMPLLIRPVHIHEGLAPYGNPEKRCQKLEPEPEPPPEVPMASNAICILSPFRRRLRADCVVCLRRSILILGPLFWCRGNRHTMMRQARCPWRQRHWLLQLL